jgi:hypothetical protein
MYLPHKLIVGSTPSVSGHLGDKGQLDHRSDSPTPSTDFGRPSIWDQNGNLDYGALAERLMVKASITAVMFMDALTKLSDADALAIVNPALKRLNDDRHVAVNAKKLAEALKPYM